MTRFFDLSAGELREFERVCAEHLSAENARSIIRDPSILTLMKDGLLRADTGGSEPDHGQTGVNCSITELWTPPSAQILQVREQNRLNDWGFTDEDFAKAASEIPTCPKDPLTALVLVPYLETPQKTFVHLWELGRARYEKFYHWDGYNSVLTDNVIRLLPGIEHPSNCLRWETINFNANRGKAPKDVRDPKTSPHAGVLASVWLHPNWVKSMDGDKVPFVWASGFQVSVPGDGPWRSVPSVWFHQHSRGVRLSCSWDDDRDSDWSVPRFSGD